MKDLTGQRFGRLTVEPVWEIRKGHAYWLCRCDCGGVKIVRGSHLKQGNVSSCGCKDRTTHGETRTRLYHIWNGMRNRCSNKNYPGYPNYGGRGISVCEEWQEYIPFRDWAITNGYQDGLSIDRIDNNGGYSPDNCRWATPREQANNTRKVRLITYNGETHSVCEWSRILNIKQSTLNMRINKYRWSAEEALRKEVRKHGS